MGATSVYTATWNSSLERPCSRTSLTGTREAYGRRTQFHAGSLQPDPLITTTIVLIASIFILLQREDLRDRMIRLFGSSDLHRTTVAMNDAARRLSRYLLTQLAVNAAFGVIIGTGLAFIGIPSPVMWGVLGALLRFVPPRAVPGNSECDRRAPPVAAGPMFRITVSDSRRVYGRETRAQKRWP